jgi:hypothetical protein
MVEKSERTGLLYRDYDPNASGDGAAGDGVPPNDDFAALDTDPQAAAEQSAREWAAWFRERFADELMHGAGGEALIHMVLGHVMPLKREIAELRAKLDTLTDIVAKGAPRKRH